MTEESEIICVTCPKGCTLKVLHEGNEVVDVLGSGCKRGKEYAICELKDPRRMVASSVRVKNGIHQGLRARLAQQDGDDGRGVDAVTFEPDPVFTKILPGRSHDRRPVAQQSHRVSDVGRGAAALPL